MADEKQKPKVQVTYLPALLHGTQNCEWEAWYRANHWYKAPFDPESKGALDHTSLLTATFDGMVADGHDPAYDNQNWFTVVGRTIDVGGKPDLITLSPDRTTGIIYDCKSGAKLEFHKYQVMLYMWLLPLSDLRQYRNVKFEGALIYPDEIRNVSSDDVDDAFVQKASKLIKRVAGKSEITVQPRPNKLDCKWCKLTENECSVKLPREDGSDSEPMTDLF